VLGLLFWLELDLLLFLYSSTMQQHYLALLLGAAWAIWNVDAAAFKPVSIKT